MTFEMVLLYFIIVFHRSDSVCNGWISWNNNEGILLQKFSIKVSHLGKSVQKSSGKLSFLHMLHMYHPTTHQTLYVFSIYNISYGGQFELEISQENNFATMWSYRNGWVIVITK